jgi:hypothetical protein
MKKIYKDFLGNEIKEGDILILYMYSLPVVTIFKGITKSDRIKCSCRKEIKHYKSTPNATYTYTAGQNYFTCANIDNMISELLAHNNIIRRPMYWHRTPDVIDNTTTEQILQGMSIINFSTLSPEESEIIKTQLHNSKQ